MDADGQYLEAAARCHKGGRSAEMKARLLPLVFPSKGIDNSNWAIIYMQLRQDSNLVLAQGEYGPMLPAPLKEEATEWAQRVRPS